MNEERKELRVIVTVEMPDRNIFDRKVVLMITYDDLENPTVLKKAVDHALFQAGHGLKKSIDAEYAK